MTNRRDFNKLIALAPLMSFFPQSVVAGTDSKLTRLIPSSSEAIPAIGMGSYQTFNVGNDPVRKQNLIAVLQAFFSAGGSVVDSSPMYGLSEQVIGELVAKLAPESKMFAASKVWTYGKQAGQLAILESQRRMQVNKMDLMQVHNLRDWKVHLDTLDEMKKNDQLRYTGITTSRISQYADFENVMKQRQLDFVQFNYNIKVREAEKRLLPLAADKGIAVIINMPFEKGRLFKLVKGKSLPEWSKEFDCETWGQFFLKFILSHPAVTCAIPATSKVHHMQDNMQAMQGRLPDKEMRQKMLRFFNTL